MAVLLHPLLAMLACCTRQELARQVAYLKEENRILRAKLPQRIRTTPVERRRLVRAGRRLGLHLKEILSICSYSTFRKWIRETETARSMKRATQRPGRLRTAKEIRDLIIRMRTETNWGYTRIMGECKKLGIKVSRQTVKNILVEAGLPVGPKPSSEDSWDAFLSRHAATLWQCDFVSKPMWTTKGLVDLYFLVFLHLGTRRCWISQCTEAPTSAWVAQQGRNFLMHAEDVELTPEIVMRDNDQKYREEFDQVFQSAGVEIKRNAYRAPNLRAHVERFIQTLKFEALDKFVIVARRHLNYINSEFQVHYNRERPHEARGGRPPDWPEDAPSDRLVKSSDVVCRNRLGGLQKSYSRRAA